MDLAVVVAIVVGLAAGYVANRLVVREPAYLYADPRDLPEGADDALLDELAPVEPLSVPVLALLRGPQAGRWWFAAVEVACATALVLTVLRYDPWAARLTVGVVLLTLVTLAAVDFRVYRIPDRINFPAMGIVLALSLLTGWELGDATAVVGSLLGGVLYAGFLFVAHIVSPGGMGWGDVKLAWLMGFALGWLGWLGWVDGTTADQVLGTVRFVLYGAVAGSFAGVLSAVPYALVERSMRAQFPYGPALALGCALILLYGPEFIA